jgi:hypothetical protein
MLLGVVPDGPAHVTASIVPGNAVVGRVINNAYFIRTRLGGQNNGTLSYEGRRGRVIQALPLGP